MLEVNKYFIGHFFKKKKKYNNGTVQAENANYLRLIKRARRSYFKTITNKPEGITGGYRLLNNQSERAKYLCPTNHRAYT